MKRGFKTFLKEEDGMGVVEIILIIVVLVSLVAIFKKEITSVVNTILKKISPVKLRLLLKKSVKAVTLYQSQPRWPQL